jgi:hypothetical protein
MLKCNMQRQQSANLVQAALLALALASTLKLSAAALTLAPDRVAVAFNRTIVIDVLANDASDPRSLRIKTQLLGAAFASRTLSIVQCGEPQHDCIEYGAPAARPGAGGVLETYRQIGLRLVSVEEKSPTRLHVSIHKQKHVLLMK